MLLWSAGGARAEADTLRPSDYRARLLQVRALVAQGATAQAEALLRRTTALQLDGAIVEIDDGPLADRLARAPSVALAEIDQLVAAAAAAESPRRPQPALADQRLQEILATAAAAPSGPEAPPWADVLGAIARALVDAFGRLFANAGVDLGDAWPLVVAIALVLVAAILVIFGRGLPERLRRESVLATAADAARADPRAYLALADAALAAGDARGALHELYRYAIASLAVRETVRYDPSLTDRELLTRTRGIAHADELRELVALHERVWFGLHDAAADEAAHARTLALAVAA